MLRATGRFAAFAAVVGAALGLVAVVAAAAPDGFVAAERAVGAYMAARWAEGGRRAAFLLTFFGSVGSLALVVAAERWIGRVRGPAVWEPIEIDSTLAEALGDA